MPPWNVPLTDGQLASLVALVLGLLYIVAWLRQGQGRSQDVRHTHEHYHEHDHYECYEDEGEDPSEAWKKGRQDDDG